MSYDPAHTIKLAADTITALRRPDVYRVLEAVKGKQRTQLVAYIKQHRPDLAGEVDDCLADL